MDRRSNPSHLPTHVRRASSSTRRSVEFVSDQPGTRARRRRGTSTFISSGRATRRPPPSARWTPPSAICCVLWARSRPMIVNPPTPLWVKARNKHLRQTSATCDDSEAAVALFVRFGYVRRTTRPRSPTLQAGGRRFDPGWLHWQMPCKRGVSGFPESAHRARVCRIGHQDWSSNGVPRVSGTPGVVRCLGLQAREPAGGPVDVCRRQRRARAKRPPYRR